MAGGFWHGRPVLVTGAAGFTGRHLVGELLDAGAQVFAALRPGGSDAEFDPRVSRRRGDLRSADDCQRLVQGIDTVFHVAAVFRTVGVTRESLFESHVTATQHLIQAAAEAGARRFVHTSTIGVQGPNPPEQALESDPAAPDDDYQVTKYEGELAVAACADSVGLPFSIVRPCAIYGAGDDRFLKIIRPIARGQFTMIGRGAGKFHLVHVRDLAAGLMLAGEKDAAVSEVFTIGGERAPTLAAFVDLIARHTGGGMLPLRVPYRLVYWAGYLCEKLCGLIGVEPPLHRRRVKFFASDRSFDLSKAASRLGYQPSVTLDDGVGALVRWHRERGDI